MSKLQHLAKNRYSLDIQSEAYPVFENEEMHIIPGFPCPKKTAIRCKINFILYFYCFLG
jgi:hypothetical protein